MGYILVRIHEVWHFDKSEEGLFADYVNTWLKLKQESVRQYKDKEGITLENVAKNPGRKQVAKLMLNGNQSFHQELSTGDDKNIAKPPLARATRSLEPRREADETGNMYQKSTWTFQWIRVASYVC